MRSAGVSASAVGPSMENEPASQPPDVPVPELSELFYESEGSLADSLKFLAQIPEAEARLFPGYAKFESSLDERVLTEQKCLRGALVREKLRALETDLDADSGTTDGVARRLDLEIPSVNVFLIEYVCLEKDVK